MYKLVCEVEDNNNPNQQELKQQEDELKTEDSFSRTLLPKLRNLTPGNVA